jgi:hypothetical protein
MEAIVQALLEILDNELPQRIRSCDIQKLINYAGNKQKSYKIMIIRMFAILNKAKPNIETIRGLNLAAFTHTTGQVTRLPW